MKHGQVLYRDEQATVGVYQQGPGFVLKVVTEKRFTATQLKAIAERVEWAKDGLVVNYSGGRHVASLWLHTGDYTTQGDA